MTETNILVGSDSAEGDSFGILTAVSSTYVVASSYAHNSLRGAVYLFGGGTTAVELSDLRAQSPVAWPSGWIGLGLLGVVPVAVVILRQHRPEIPRHKKFSNSITALISRGHPG